MCAWRGGEMEVDITDISTSDKLNINLSEVGGSYLFGGRIPVSVDD
ncbi:MAG: hypothetical protein U5L96_15955 [Owenweeksia sp.]|nr:hypothetical protein [Owenweeksia sp.]